MLIYLVNPSARPYIILENPIYEKMGLIPNYVTNEYISCRRTPGEKREYDALQSDRGGQEITAKKLPIPNGGHPVYDINILESYFYARTNKVIDKLIPYFGNFLLDSGAFTFMSNSKVKVDWDRYTEEYADYINKHDIKLFFELDIDSIVGLGEVERLRHKLETLTGKKSIPVWHISRGKDYFVRMCEGYEYVAFGGILTDGVSSSVIEKAFPWFINTAHCHQAKIHGLGYTRIEQLKKFHFDSVDSTAWLYGNRGGYAYKFNPLKGSMDKVDVPDGKRMKSRDVALHNFNEWVKYSQWAKKYL